MNVPTGEVGRIDARVWPLVRLHARVACGLRDRNDVQANW